MCRPFSLWRPDGRHSGRVEPGRAGEMVREEIGRLDAAMATRGVPPGSVDGLEFLRVGAMVGAWLDEQPETGPVPAEPVTAEELSAFRQMIGVAADG